MEDWLLAILLLGIAAFVAWALLQTRLEFEIRIDDSHVYVRRGKVTPAFVDFVATVCREAGVAHGWVGGERRGKRVALRFSRNFPRGPSQRLRNEWQLT